jgi:putative RecB family exonuclease
MIHSARENILSQLHISYSQIFTYLSCSLKYQFRYVLCRPQEKMGLALAFGSALHKALERYYRSHANGQTETLTTLQELFCEVLTGQLTDKKEIVVYSKTIPDADSAIEMGRAMLKIFHESIDLAGYRIVDVELPLSAKLYTDAGSPTQINLVGYIDLLLEDPNGELLVVDHKTAARSKTQADVDADLQMTTYSYLLAANRYVFPTAAVKGRFDVLRKLKTPKLEHYHTQRCPDDRKRLAKIATQVLAGIEARVFIPNRSWLCLDCEYARACSNWHKESEAA